MFERLTQDGRDERVLALSDEPPVRRPGLRLLRRARRRPVLVAAVALAWCAAPASGAARPDRFIATSGIPHFDIADVSNLPGWDPADGNSTSPAWEAAIDDVLAVMAAEPGVDATLMTGDLVNGEWGLDDSSTGIFGPVATVAEQRAAVRRAARTYYGAILRRWAAHPALGPVFPAAGDHELGGIPPSGVRGRRSHAARMFRTARASWRRAFGHRTHYLRRLPGRRHVWLATLSPVRRTGGRLVPEIGGRQLEWLRHALRGKSGWKVVQVEIPPSQVAHHVHSSESVLRDGPALWAAARRLGVQLIVSAEDHAFNVVPAPGRHGQPGPIVVTSGGGMYGGGTANYLVVDVGRRALTLTAKTVRCVHDGAERLWQTTMHRPRAHFSCAPAPETQGTLALRRDGTVTAAAGLLAVQGDQDLAPRPHEWGWPG